MSVLVNYKCFTKNARQVVTSAERFARELHNPMVRPMHTLLGILATESEATSLLNTYGLTLEEVKQFALKMYPVLTAETINYIPLTNDSRRVFENGDKLRHDQSHAECDVQHLALGLFQINDPNIKKILMEFEVIERFVVDDLADLANEMATHVVTPSASSTLFGLVHDPTVPRENLVEALKHLAPTIDEEAAGELVQILERES